MTDLGFKAKIEAEYDRTKDGPKAISDRLGCDYGYAKYVLRFYRGEGSATERQRFEEADEMHLRLVRRALPFGCGFPAFKFRSAA